MTSNLLTSSGLEDPSVPPLLLSVDRATPPRCRTNTSAETSGDSLRPDLHGIVTRTEESRRPDPYVETQSGDPEDPNA